jgi:signal transduction histidine kinase
MGSTEHRTAWERNALRGRDTSAEEPLFDPVAAAQLVQVAHDLRSPLSSVLLLVEQLRSGKSGPLTPLMERQLSIVHNATLGVASVVADLMDVGRDGMDLLDGAPVTFSLASLVGQVRDLVQPMAEQKGLLVRVHTPIADARRGHPAAVRRVLLNLVTNAVKFTARGGVDLIAEDVDMDGVRITVRDTGRGMLSRPTTAFPSSEGGTAAAFSSSGLGLALCRRLVVEMRGTMEIDATPDHGTRVVVTLPL